MSHAAAADDILAKARERLAEIDSEILKLAAEKLQLQRMLSPAPVAPVLPALPPIMPTEPTGPFWEIPRPLPYERTPCAAQYRRSVARHCAALHHLHIDRPVIGCRNLALRRPAGYVDNWHAYHPRHQLA
jgi:hypothetical protein